MTSTPGSSPTESSPLLKHDDHSSPKNSACVTFSAANGMASLSELQRRPQGDRPAISRLRICLLSDWWRHGGRDPNRTIESGFRLHGQGCLQPDPYPARDGDDLSLDRSSGQRGLRKLSDSLLCGCQGYGIPQTECGCLLAHSSSRTDAHQQLFHHGCCPVGLDSLSTAQHHNACHRSNHLDSECSASGWKFNLRRH